MNKHLLFQTMSMQAESRNQKRMQRFIRRHARKLGANIIEHDQRGNIYVTKGAGPIYPCVVAHTDTVHNIVPNEQFQIIREGDTWFAFDPIHRKLRGIGGDDKVGIFIALAALEAFDNIKLVFFVDEEIGCQGSSKADMSFFEDTTFVLQCDRRGYGEVVREIYGTELFGDEFEQALGPIMARYEMESETWGGITDVGELKERNLKVACTNIACGYYLPHTNEEYINLTHVEATHDMVFDVIRELGGQVWPHEFTYVPSSYAYGYGRPYGTGWGDETGYWETQTKALPAVGTNASKQSSTGREWPGRPVTNGFGEGGTKGVLPMIDVPSEDWPWSITIQDMPFTAWSRCPLCDSVETEWQMEHLDFQCHTCGYYFGESIDLLLEGKKMMEEDPDSQYEDGGNIDAMPAILIDPDTFDAEEVANRAIDDAYGIKTHNTVEGVIERLKEQASITSLENWKKGRGPGKSPLKDKVREKVKI